MYYLYIIVGLVLQESCSSQHGDEERSFMVQHQFNRFTHWELDSPPNSDNQTQKSLHWLSLSRVVSVRFRAICGGGRILIFVNLFQDRSRFLHVWCLVKHVMQKALHIDQHIKQK